MSAATKDQKRSQQQQRLRVVDGRSETGQALKNDRLVRERRALVTARELTRKAQVDIKIVRAQLLDAPQRWVFYFTSPQRVDFRLLLKQLAAQLGKRVEMQHVGVRDAARHTGGTGVCGRSLCCSTWLPAFQPVSLRMAKDQNLALNQDKLSGVCGRLRCCLRYEQDLYKEARKGLPKVGKRVLTPKGEGRVRELNVLMRTARVALADGGSEVFAADSLKPVNPPAAPPSQPPTTAPSTDLREK